jgi:small nuclear ribonucleoprotein (snRNP)-like protein
VKLIRERLFRQVVVTLKGGSTWEGVLVGSDREALTLRNVVHLLPGADRPTPVDGELMFFRSEVLFLQFT